jgi:hypothetical protein
MFTARYALSPYIKQTRFVFKGLNKQLGGSLTKVVINNLNNQMGK